MEIVAIVSLGRSVEQEAPLLAADLGLTAYETGMMLRAPTPIIVYRGDDRTRTFEVLGKLRARGHDAIACDAAQITSSDDMFRPKTFRLEGTEVVAFNQGDEGRLAFGDIMAFVRATHFVHTENKFTNREKPKTGRNMERVTDHREPVLYVFRSDTAPWLLNAQGMLYDGLGRDMKVSKAENFELLINLLRQSAPNAPYDARLLQVRLPATIVSSGTPTAAAGSLDILAHVVAMALNRAARPYR